jgi:hypothetical protein
MAEPKDFEEPPVFNKCAPPANLGGERDQQMH